MYWSTLEVNNSLRSKTMPSLQGKVAIVTGASRGIGRAIAERLGHDGAYVVVNYSGNAEKAQEVVQAIAAAGSKAIAIQADLSNPDDIRHLFDETEKQFGHLDILVNNAGTFVMKPAIDITLEEFDKVMSINVRGVFLALQEAARRIHDGGRIVNLASNATIQSLANTSIYAASKAAVEQFTRVLAKELGTRQITVNAVAPGATETDMVPDVAREMVPKMTPLGRLGQPEDIADVVAFVVSEEARWITGQTIGVSGGIV
jgi:3-oxoacyl-[acyl-carrier protein] reductase